METVRKALTIFGMLIGLAILVYGLWLWAQYGYPLNELIPYKNTFGTNPIHFSYIGLVIVIGSVFHGALKYGWFNFKS